MKLITTLVLSLLSFASFAQSTQIGFETGTIAYYNLEYFSSGKPIILHKHWKQADFNNGIFVRHETKSHWAFQLTANYYSDKHSATRESSLGATTIYFQSALSQNIFNYAATVQYCLNNKKAIAKHTTKILISYIGVSYTRLQADCKYSFSATDGPNTLYPTTYAKTNWSDDLLGLNYWGRYGINKRLAVNLDLSAKISTRYTSQAYPFDNDAILDRYTLKKGRKLYIYQTNHLSYLYARNMLYV